MKKKKTHNKTPSNMRLNINIYWTLADITPELPSANACCNIDVVIKFIALLDNNAAVAACISLTIRFVSFYPTE